MTERLDARRIAQPAYGSRRNLVDLLILLLLLVSFFLGPLKLLGISWLSYVVADGLAVMVLLIVLWERIAARMPLLAESPLSVPFALLAGYCVLELLNPEAPFIRSLLGLRSWLLYLSFYLVGLYTLRSERQVDRLYIALLTLGALTAGYGIYQWQAGPEAFASWSDYYGQYARLTWSAHSGAVFRAFSTFVMPGAFGGSMALLMLLAFGIIISSRFQTIWRVVAAIAFFTMGVGIAASGSRGPIVQLLLAGVVALAFVQGIRRKFGVVFKATVMGGTAGMLVVFLIGPAISERFTTIFDPQAFFWKWFGPFMDGIRIAQAHPFGMGMGFTAGVPQFISNPVIQNLPTMSIDSGYGSAAAELGVIGLGLFIYFAFKVGIEGFRVWRRMPVGRLRDLLFGPALFAATFPLVSVIFQPQATLPSSIFFWLLIGILMRAERLEPATDADSVLRSQIHARQ